MPTFLHAADLHLDSPLRGLEQKKHAPTERLRKASRCAFEKLVARAIERKVAFALLAGDLYDVQPAFETYRFFHDQVKRLTAVGIPVAIVLGNHDHAGIAPRAGRLPEGVKQFSKDAAESWEIVPGVVVHGRSYPVRDVVEDLTPGYPAASPGKLNVGLLHTALAGYQGDHQKYAPTTAAVLANRGYQYWALGHVHGHVALVENGVHLVFPGNLQGRHAKETGPKGAVFVDYLGPTIQRVEHEAFDDVRWHHVDVNAAGVPEDADPVGFIEARILGETRETRNAGKLAAVRVGVHGEASRRLLELGEVELRESLMVKLDADGSIFLEKVSVEVHPSLVDRSEAERQFAELVQAMTTEPERRKALGAIVEELRARLRNTDGTLADSGAFKGKRTDAPSEQAAEEMLSSAFGLIRELMMIDGGRNV